MKVAVTGFHPAQVALGRILLGALTLAVIMTVTRRRWPRERRIWLHMVVVGTLLCVIPFLLFAWAAQTLPSGLSAILNATTPLWTVLVVVVALPAERLGGWRLCGVLLGVLGVALVMGLGQVLASPEFLDSVPAQLACLGATASYGLALGWMRRFVTGTHSHDSVTVAATQLAVAAAIAAVLAPFVARDPITWSFAPAASLLTLGALGTGIAYICTWALTQWGAVAASTVTYVVPLVAVTLGILVLGEQLTANQLIGAAVVIAGVMMTQRGQSRTQGAK